MSRARTFKFISHLNLFKRNKVDRICKFIRGRFQAFEAFHAHKFCRLSWLCGVQKFWVIWTPLPYVTWNMRSFIFICFTNFALPCHSARRTACTLYSVHKTWKRICSLPRSQPPTRNVTSRVDLVDNPGHDWNDSDGFQDCVRRTVASTIRSYFRLQKVWFLENHTGFNCVAKPKSPKEIYELRACKCACENRLWNGRIRSHHISQREDEIRSTSSDSFSKF